MPEKYGNAGALGLAAFGLTTTLLNLKNAKIIGTGAMPMIYGMGMFFGGFAQLFAGVLEWIVGNTFGFVAFCGYGCFWLSFCFMHFFPVWGLSDPLDSASVASYLFIWGVFTAGMTWGTIKNRAPWLLTTLFATLTVLFFGLGLGDSIVAGGSEKAGEIVAQIFGYEGIGVGLLSVYLSIADINGWPVLARTPAAKPHAIQLDEVATDGTPEQTQKEETNKEK